MTDFIGKIVSEEIAEKQEYRMIVSRSQEVVKNLIQDITMGMADTDDIMAELFRLSVILNKRG